MTITVRTSNRLLEHLSTHRVDGTTVAESLFEGGRLCYPGRQDVERQLGHTEPYTLQHEARVLMGLPRRTEASIRLLAAHATDRHTGLDTSLDVLWRAHGDYAGDRDGPSLDRLVAALVAVHELQEGGGTPDLVDAATCLVATLHAEGLPPTHEGLEELFDGADPACVGLGIVVL